MIKVYIPDISNTKLGGGFTFKSNLIKGLKDKVQFIDNWRQCDVILVFSITTINKGEIYEAVKLHRKKLVLRVDNIPRKSRNVRQSPAERLREFGKIADKVVYQSEWAKEYAGYFAGDGVIVYNGVDTEIFNTKGRDSDGKTYLYADYNPNPNKRFDEALYWFDLAWRKDNSVHLIIAGNVPNIYLEHPEYNWDLPTPGKVEYIGIMQTLEEMAKLYKRCDYLLYPSFAEACPNVVAEALACGLKIIGVNKFSGTIETIYKHGGDRVDQPWQYIGEDTFFPHVKPYTIQQMGEEYLKVFEEICQK